MNINNKNKKNKKYIAVYAYKHSLNSCWSIHVYVLAQANMCILNATNNGFIRKKGFCITNSHKPTKPNAKSASLTFP
jgi:hypothetical protein